MQELKKLNAKKVLLCFESWVFGELAGVSRLL